MKKTVLSKSVKGELAELVVSYQLISRGYLVFKNAFSTGPVDLIVIDPDTDEVYKIDVKSVVRRTIGQRKLTEDQKAMNVFLGLIKGEDAIDFIEQYDVHIEDSNGRVLNLLGQDDDRSNNSDRGRDD